MSVTAEPPFGKFRALCWPIYRHELKRFIPMLLILCFICFNYAVLHNLKDALVITASTSGAEVIPFIKVWALLPTALLITYIFTKLTSRYGQRRVFYIIITGFLASYAFFTFVLYPARDILHPHETADFLEQLLPTGCKGLITMFRNWTFTGFYVMCELWSNIIMTVMFWGFANEITRIQEAGRFYSIWSVGANIATIAAGIVGNMCVFQNYSPMLPFGHDAWEQTIMALVSLIIASGIISLLLFHWLNKYALDTPSDGAQQPAVTVAKVRPPKKRLSIKDSFAYLANSKYLICIAALVVCYNMAINLNEITWKDQLRILYPSPSDYNTYMNDVTTITGIVSLFPAFFIGHIISRCGWSFTALITPVIMLVTSVGFFGFLLFKDNLSDISMTLFGTSPLVIVVFFGFIQNCLSKASKYSLFDATKEMAFIPLPNETKLKGKAAIDGVGSRLGKSGSSFMYQGLLIFLSSLPATAPYIALILAVVIVGWILAARSLGKQFNTLVGTPETPSESDSSAPTPATV